MPTILDFLFPKTVYRKTSSISGEIKVKKQLGQYTLSVQGVIQSGGLVKDVWRKVLYQVEFFPKKVLILGLGGGTLVHLIKERWPAAKIIGIEIDSEIIKVSQKFFGLNQVKNLKIIQANAFQWVKKKGKFDLVLVDLYLGGQFPIKAEEKEFLEDIKKLLSRDSLVVFNRLRTDSTEKFEKRLANCFSSLEKVKSSTNLFFVVKL